MKQLYIDNSKRLVVVNGKPVPRLLLGIIQGAIGKLYVVKRYRGKRKKRKIVVTRYPDMSGVVASEKQRQRRDLFREAVVYAQWILSDAERKEAFRQSLPRKKRKHVYQAAIRLYMSRQGDPQWLSRQLAVRGMMRSGRKEWVKEVVWNWELGIRERVPGNWLEGQWKVVWRKEVRQEEQGVVSISLFSVIHSR